MEYDWMPVKKRARKPRKVESEWSPSDVYMLIQLVEQRDFLWDTSKSSHKDTKMREKSFRVIAEALNRSLGDCKTKWDNLRAQYRGYQSKAGQNISIKWQYFEALGFLKKVCEPRKVNKINMPFFNPGINNDPNLMRPPFTQSQSPYIQDMDTCSSFFSTARRRVHKEEDASQLNEDTMMSSSTKSAQEQTSISAQIFGDFVADQMRTLNPNLADELKKNILKLVLEALEKNKN